ncbi:MAG: NPCBM/NEW2 domain-containing protein [Planctomycetota bacterium]
MTKRAAIITITVTVLGAVALGGGSVETVDSRTIEGLVSAIDAENVTVRTAEKAVTVSRKNLGEVVLQEGKDLLERPGRTVVVTRDGGMFDARSLTMDKGKLTLTTELLGKVTLDIAAVSEIYTGDTRRSAKHTQKRAEQMGLSAASLDRMLVEQSEKKWLSVTGVLKSIKDGKITFRFNDADRQIGLGKVTLIRIAKMTRKSPSPAGILVGKGGTRVAFTDIRMDANSVKLTPVNTTARTIDRKLVAKLEFISDSVKDLTQLKPAKVTEHGFFGTSFPYKKNLSVGGRPLRMNKTTYRRGLGLHSFCELTYEIDGSYKTFVAIAGIDDEVRPHGDAQLIVLGDGKKLAEYRITGRDKPTTVRVKIDGVKKLTLRVDFGQDKLGVSDHVNLGAPRLIK